MFSFRADGKGPAARILVLGCGHVDGLDDALGPALAQEIGRLDLDGVSVDWCDELTIEKALTVAEHELVVFVTVAFEGRKPFVFKAVDANGCAEAKCTGGRINGDNPAGQPLSPGRLLRVAAKLSGRATEGYALTVRGYDLGIGEELSEPVRRNLAKAVAFLEAAICLRLVA